MVVRGQVGSAVVKRKGETINKDGKKEGNGAGARLWCLSHDLPLLLRSFYAPSSCLDVLPTSLSLTPTHTQRPSV